MMGYKEGAVNANLRKALVVICMILGIVLSGFVGDALDESALAVVAGVVFGVIAAIPVSVLLLMIFSRAYSGRVGVAQRQRHDFVVLVKTDQDTVDLLPIDQDG